MTERLKNSNRASKDKTLNPMTLALAANLQFKAFQPFSKDFKRIQSKKKAPETVEFPSRSEISLTRAARPTQVICTKLRHLTPNYALFETLHGKVPSILVIKRVGLGLACQSELIKIGDTAANLRYGCPITQRA